MTRNMLDEEADGFSFPNFGDTRVEYPQNRRLSKAQRRAEKRSTRATQANVIEVKPLIARNEIQQDMIDAMEESSQIFAIGPAGTGKTYVAARWAMNQLVSGNTSRIVISRPTVTKNKHRQGFLPGNEKEKIEPWLIPIVSAFKEGVSSETVAKMTRDGRIEYLSFETMRGRSIKDSVLILDEAQNCDFGDLRMFLTRIGENSKVIICGDPDQVDINDSGLKDVLDMIEDYDLSPDIIEFTEDDVVRSGIASEWVKAFKRHARES